MYIPCKFEEPNIEVMPELVRAQPLATLITLNANMAGLVKSSGESL